MKRKIVRGALLAALAMGPGSQPASAQNFFEMLFGGARLEGRSAYQPQDYVRPNPLPAYGRQNAAPIYGRRSAGHGSGTLDPNDPRLHRAIIRHRAAAKPPARKVVARKVESAVVEDSSAPVKNVAVVATPDAPRGSIPYFLKDKTLRAGDVVVTDKGFLVFQGGEHRSRSFVAINASSNNKSERKNLLALEEVSRMRTPNLTVEMTTVMRDFIGPRLPEQMDERFNAALTITKTASR